MSRIFPTKRRAFLGGAGVCVALPFLEALTPKEILGQQGVAPKRFAGVFIPNGMVMDSWRPTGTGANFELGRAMGPQRPFNDGLTPYPAEEDGPGLEGLRDHLLVISGLQNTEEEQGPGDHAGGVGSFLTNRTVNKTAGVGMKGPSLDFLLAQKIGQDTSQPNLVMLGKEGKAPGSNCDSGYPCSVGAYITYDLDGQNVPHIGDPGQVFNTLFAGFDPGVSAETLAAVRALDRSILDTVHAQGKALLPSLASQDRARLDKYLTSVRDIELRLGVAGGGVCAVPERPAPGFGPSNKATMDIYSELMALAFQCNITRVASFMWGMAVDGRKYESLGADTGHHAISHHQNDEVKLNKLRRINYWYYRRLAAMGELLRGMEDVDGRTLLDNTLIFQSCDISDGDDHNHNDMPVVLLGGGAGFQMGRHLSFTDNDDRWFGHLFTSIGQAFGLDITEFGERGDGPLTGLLA
jgi:Protein of unknown function (DUF1552)